MKFDDFVCAWCGKRIHGSPYSLTLTEHSYEFGLIFWVCRKCKERIVKHCTYRDSVTAQKMSAVGL